LVVLAIFSCTWISLNFQEYPENPKKKPRFKVYQQTLLISIRTTKCIL
jgi:hypothetical protein